MFITKFCCSSINLMLQGNKDEIIYDKDILELANHEVFFKSNPIVIVDTCLLILISMSYAIPSRDDLLSIFQETIEINVPKLITKPSSPVVDDK